MAIPLLIITCEAVGRQGVVNLFADLSLVTATFAVVYESDSTGYRARKTCDCVSETAKASKEIKAARRNHHPH